MYILLLIYQEKMSAKREDNDENRPLLSHRTNRSNSTPIGRGPVNEHRSEEQSTSSRSLTPASVNDVEVVNTGTSPRKSDESDEINAERGQTLFALWLPVVLLLIGITCTQTLSTYMISNSSNVVPKVTLLVYMSLALLMICWVYYCSESTGSASLNISTSNVRYILRNHLSVVGLVIFFPFSCLLDFAYVIADISCDRIWYYCGSVTYDEYVTDVLYHVFRMIFMGAELLFCLQFHKRHLKRTVSLGFALSCIMIANIGLWFASIVSETSDRTGNPGPSGEMNISYSCNMTAHEHYNETEWQSCIGQTNAAFKFLQHAIMYLYPFTIEFSMLVGEFLAAKIFITINNADTRCPAEQISQEVEQHDSPPLQQRFYWLSVLIIGVGAFINLVYFSLSCIGDNDDKKAANSYMKTEEVIRSKISIGFSIAAFGFLNLLIIAGFLCGILSKHFRFYPKKLRGIDWLILLSVFGPVMYELIHITAVATNMSRSAENEDKALFIGSKLTNLIQFFLQTPFIYFVERWKPNEELRRQQRMVRLDEVIKAIALVMAITNLTNWIADSVILTKVLSLTDDMMNNIFQSGSWMYVDKFLVPFMIFYRFNSFLLFLRAYLGD